jgi:class 3 adenylate cyclase/tetratricopeptide (TPR) repeat protein
VFADLSGFTQLSEAMDPEDVTAMLDGCMRRMAGIVEQFGGRAMRVIGDQLMTLFGAPVAHEDDPERAVRAALELQRYAADHLEDFRGLSLRVGVNTGEMMYAPVGPDRDFTVMGDPVNTASRLQSNAPRGGILVGKETYLATRAAIRYRDVEPLIVKGKTDPVFAALAVEPLSGPGERLVSGAPMVGRLSESALLGTIWERVVGERLPYLVTIMGAPGVGKTRLCREIVGSVLERGGRAVQGRSLPYGQSTGYGAFGQQLKVVAGIYETDSSSAAREKLARTVGALLPAETAEEVTSHLALIMGLSAEHQVTDRGPLFFSARRFLEALATEQPTALVFEDIHWADPSLLDLLEFLSSRIRETPLLLITLARPELLDRRPTWGSRFASYALVELRPLSPVDAEGLLRQLLPGVADASIIARLVEATGGNPLFAEELAASFAERVTQTAAAMPTNIKAIIAARLDTLPAAERQVLLDASVVGKVFWQGALERFGGNGRNTSWLLDSLEARDLIRAEPRSQFVGDREFSFKHILIREVAYATLPRAARRARHAIVARFIEEAAADRLGESASLLAHHWREAGDRDQALRYLLIAAENASRAWAKGEALALLTQALELVPTEDRAQRVRIRLSRATTMRESADYPAAAAEFEAVLPGLEGRERIEALIGRARAGYWLADTEGAQEYSSRAVELAEVLDEEQLQARALSVASLAAALDGNLGRAIDLSESALAHWDAEHDIAELGIHEGFVGVYQYWAGHFERAVECCRRAFDLGMQTHNVEAMVAGGGNLGMALAGLGRHEEAVQFFEKVVALGSEIELKPTFTSRATNMLAGTLRETFDLKRARELNELGVELAARASFGWAHTQGRIDLVVADLIEGDVGSAEKAWPELWETALVTKGLHRWLMAGRLATLRAEIDAALGHPEEAADSAREALAFAQRHGRVKYEVASRVALGSALLDLRSVADAVAELRRAMAEAENLGHPPTCWRTASALTRALAAFGDDDGAEVVSLVAAHTVKEFAQSLSEGRRDGFLGAPSVAEILSRV